MDISLIIRRGLKTAFRTAGQRLSCHRFYIGQFCRIDRALFQLIGEGYNIHLGRIVCVLKRMLNQIRISLAVKQNHALVHKIDTAVKIHCNDRHGSGRHNIAANHRRTLHHKVYVFVIADTGIDIHGYLFIRHGKEIFPIFLFQLLAIDLYGVNGAHGVRRNLQGNFRSGSAQVLAELFAAVDDNVCVLRSVHMNGVILGINCARLGITVNFVYLNIAEPRLHITNCHTDIFCRHRFCKLKFIKRTNTVGIVPKRGADNFGLQLSL